MRTSSYNIYVKIPDSEEYLLVHGYSGAIDLVQPNVVKFLKNFDGRSYDGVSPTTIELLKKRGYLTEKSFDEEKTRVKELAEVIQRKSKGASFYFVITYDCNLRCSYCYEKNLKRKGKEWIQTRMSKELVDKAFQAMKKIESEPGIKKVKDIGLYGGEPFLASNYDIVEYIFNKGIEQGYVFNAVTNGVDLDRYLPFLGKGKIERLQITLDGPPEEHDKRRFLADKSGSFNMIADNITNALETGVFINLRINIDQENINGLEILSDIFYQKAWVKFDNFSPYTVPLHHSGKPLKSSYFTLGDFMSKMDSLRSTKMEIIRENDYDVLTNFKNALRKGSLLQFRASHCGSNRGMYLFDPFGDIYACWDAVGNQTNKVGIYSPELSLIQSEIDKWHKRIISSIPECSKCKYAFFCGGGCAQFAYNRNGCYFSSYCSDFPKVFHKFVPIAYKQFLSEQKNKNLKGGETRDEIKR